MIPTFSIVEMTPTIEDYARVIESVGWRPRQPEAIEIALRNSCFSVCAVSDGVVVGFGRVIGDGGLHLYVTEIVAALTRWVEEFPFRNTVVAVLPIGGLAAFHERHGFKAHSNNSPQMSRWIKPEPASLELG